MHELVLLLAGIFSPLANAHTPGMAVLVKQNGRAVFKQGYGVTDLNSLAPIDQTTNFRLASCTKQFTAMAVMLLVHDGKLRYDEPLSEIFPEFPPYGQTITIRHLLTHTSGLPDYEDLMDATWTETHQIQDQDVLRLLEKQQKPKFQAGTGWAYSNSAYVLLGLIVAKVSGESFGDFLNQRIFQPLRMDRTLAYVNGVNSVPNRAFGHTRQGDAFLETDQSSTSATLGDGGVYSNLDDLAKWDTALQRHTLLSEKEMTPALTPSPLKAYGFGWFLDPYQGHPRMWHTGETMGFRTVIERFPKDGLTIIVLCNRTDLDPAKLALQAADLILQ
jgi:CubicO group peptidase (beta-lactamase class C family)